MAAKTYYLTNGVDGNGWQALSESTQSAVSITGGWIVGSTAPGSNIYSEFASAVERLESTFVATVFPDGVLDTTLKDAFRTPQLHGYFDNGTWDFHGVVRAITNGGAQDGRVRVRVIRADADGSNATELTAAVQNGATVSNVSTSADFDSSASISLSGFACENQYLFFQIAWERTGAGGMTTADIAFRTGSSSSVGTRIGTPNFTDQSGTGARDFHQDVNHKQQALYTSTVPTTAVDNFTTRIIVRTNSSIPDAASLFTLGSENTGWAFNIFNGDGSLQLIRSGSGIDTTVNLSASTWYDIIVKRTSGAWKVFINGTDSGLSHSTAPTTPANLLALGCRMSSTPNPTNGTVWEGRIAEFAVWERAISDGEITTLYNSGTFKHSDQISTTSLVRQWQLGGTAGARPETDTVSSATLTHTTGYPLVIAGPTFGGSGVTITPDAGSLVFSGLVPAVVISTAIQVAAGSLSLTGHAPTVVLHTRPSPSAGTLTLTGQAPTLTLRTVINTPAGALSFSGHAPTVSIASAVQVPAGALTFTGFAPTVTVSGGGAINVTPPAGSLTFAGLAPSIRTNVGIPAGSLSLTGLAPNLITPKIITPGAGSLTFTGYAPTVLGTAEYRLTIAGVEKDIRIETLDIHETANGRGTFSAEVVSVDGTYRPALRAEVIFTYAGVRIFGGNISQPSESGLGGIGGTPIVTKITAVDFNALADRVVVTATIPAGTLKAALQVLDDYLTPYGVTLDVAQVTGPSLPELPYENRKLSDIFNELSALTDYAYVWEIDYNKTLRMFTLSGTAAPYNIITGNGNAIGDIRVEPSTNDFANYIILLAGSGTREVTVSFTGTGSQTQFDLTYPLASHRGYVTNASTNETLGAVGEGATWAYNPALGTYGAIVRTSAPANGAAIEIIYTAQFPLRVIADSGAAAADRVQKLITAPDTFDATVAQELANAELVRSLLTPKSVYYRSHRLENIHPGQAQTITVTARGINGSCLVRDVRIHNPDANLVVRDVTAVEGSTLVEDFRDTIKSWGSSVIATGGGTLVSSGTVGVGGTGTAGKLPKWATATTLGDSLASENGSVITIAGTLVLTGTSISIAGETITSGTGSPEGVITATPGSLYLQDNGTLWTKATGSGNTGWASATLSGSGTAGTLTKWTSSTVLGNSLLTESGSTISVAGHLIPLTTDTYDLGRYDKLWNQGYLAQLNAILFALETQTLFGGYSTIGYRAGSFAAAVAAANNQIDFGQAMTSGHFVLVRAQDTSGAYTSEYLSVGAVVTGTTYDVTRNLSGLGAKNWAQGVPFLVLGGSGFGRIDLLAYDSKPRIQFVEQGATYNAQTVRGVLGNLDGYYGMGNVYGAAFGAEAAANIVIDPTNGIRIRYSTTNKITLDASGNASFTGSVTAASGTIGGYTIGSGALSATGIDLFSNTSNPSGKVGVIASDGVANWSAILAGTAGTDIGLMVGGTTPTSAPFRVTLAGAFTATSATITGSITSTSGAIGGFTIGATTISATNLTFTSGAAGTAHILVGTGSTAAGLNSADSGSSIAIWAGSSHANRGTAPFRVTAGGDLTATSATISGAITATSGSVTGTFAVSGGALTAGSGAVTLDNNGITLSAGTGTTNKLKWSDGTELQSNSDTLTVSAGNQISLVVSAGDINLQPGGGLTQLSNAVTVPDIGTDTGTTLVRNASNHIKRDSSSLRYKTHVERWAPVDPLAILRASPIQFDFIKGTKGVVGFSAEQLHAIDPALVNLDTEGRPDSVRTQALIAHLVMVAQSLQAKVEALEAR